jgi:hypothetical protein
MSTRGKGIALKDNKFALFSEDGDAINDGSPGSLETAVKDACAVLMKDWGEKK